MSKLERPTTTEGVQPGHTGLTEEWGRVTVTRKRGNLVWFDATGGRREAGHYSFNLDFFFHITRWETEDE